MPKIIIPTPLRKFTQNVNQVTVDGTTVNDALQQLVTRYPDLKKQLFDEAGNLRSFIKVFVGDSDINKLEKTATQVSQDAVISLVPAIAGGIHANNN